MKKSFSFLLLSTLLFSSYTAGAPNISPKTRPQALWTVKGNTTVNLPIGDTTVALAFWPFAKPDFIYLRVEEGVDKEKTGKDIIGYETAFNRIEVLKALKEGSFAQIYKNSPTHESVMPKRNFLNETVENAFAGKKESTSEELCVFCTKVDHQLDLVQRRVAVPADLPDHLHLLFLAATKQK